MTRITVPMPQAGESQKRFKERREVFCNSCHRWVLQEAAGWQHRCISAWVWTCHGCIRAHYERHQREVPDALHRVEKVAPPSSIQSLWDLHEELKDE